MRWSVISAIVLILVSILHQGESAGRTWRKYIWAGGSFWRYYSTPMDWHSAQKHCQKDGAYLAIADSNQKIHKLKRKLSYDAWIGLSKAGSQWKWVNGQSLGNPNWLSGQPNGGDCVYSRRVSSSRSSSEDGKWLDESCSSRKGFVCESNSGCVAKNPCINGGKCSGIGRSTRCTCPAGFAGTNCEQDKRPCISFNPCKHGARCTNKGTDYACSCPTGYQGKSCEIDKRPCYAYNPCKQRAKCVNKGADYSCSCPSGFSGKNCEIDQRACYSFNPCRNGAGCHSKGVDYSCKCPAGFVGKNCEQDKRPCYAFNPCKNGARCTNKGTDYSCACPAGYAGKSCEQDKRPCYAFNPCKHGARCTNKGADYRCACPAGFSGKSCEIDKRPCIAFNPCKNGARCVNKGLSYQCACKAGFKGKNCEIRCASVSKGGLPEKVDLLFVVDGSLSVHQGPFEQGLKFISKVVQKIDISAAKGRVGLIQYSHKVQTDKIIDLKKSAALGKGKLVQAISQTPYMGGGTNVGPALEEALKIFQNEGRSGNVAKYIMVLSDGESRNPKLLTAAMKKIRAAKIKTFAIGVGAEAKSPNSRKQLVEIAQGNGKHVFEVENYDKLNDQLLKQIVVSQCD